MSMALRVFLPFATAYLFAFLLRVVNAVAGEPIAGELGLSPGELGFLTSVYFMGFALSQIPFGIMMDRFGARRVEAGLLVVAAAGCAMFVFASQYAELVVGRALIGIGVSMCLMAPFTAYRRAFSPRKMPLIVGLHMIFGGIGSAIGGGPAEWLIEWLGWRGLFAVIAGLTLASAALVFALVPRSNEPKEGVPLAQLTKELGAIARSRALWRIAPLSATSQVGMLAIASLWTGPWLREVAGLSSGAAALWLSALSLGLVAGFLGYGYAASLAERVGRTMDVFVGGSLLYAAATLVIILAPPAIGTPVWLLAAAFGTVGVISYPIAVQHFPPEMAGRVNTMLNFIVFATAFAVQWFFGVILDWFPDGEGGATTFGFQVALAATLVLQLLSYLPLLVPAHGPRAAPTRAG
jgi:MFS family permease